MMIVLGLHIDIEQLKINEATLIQNFHLKKTHVTNEDIYSIADL